MSAALAPVPYLDSLAKSRWVPTTGYANGLPESLARSLNACGNSATMGKCGCDDRWLKVQRCGREWCPACGEKKSEMHLRRYARWIKRLRTVEDAGYMVVTFDRPGSAAREALLDPKNLTAVGKAIARAMKAEGFTKGLRRWHFYGDGGKGGHRSPRGQYHPHLNLMLGDAGYLAPPLLERVKQAVRDAAAAALAMPDLRDATNCGVHYSYRRGPAKLCFTARYITRATFTNAEWDTNLAERLHGFRNDAWWGDWSGEPKWDLTVDPEGVGAVGELEDGACPDCKAPIHWERGVLWLATLPAELVQSVGGGYLRLLGMGRASP